MNRWCFGLLTIFFTTGSTFSASNDRDSAALMTASTGFARSAPPSMLSAAAPPSDTPGRAPQGLTQTDVEETRATAPVDADVEAGRAATREHRVRGRDPAAVPDADLPAVWIGVRVTPVPAPLAAHIGPAGALVANIVKGSPADDAGLARYDIIVKFAGHEIAGPSDLPAVVAKATPGEPVAVQVIRAGAPRELRITPRKRPSGPPGEMKYPEPEEEALVRDDLLLHGLRVRPDLDGEWLVEDLGPLPEIPDILREFSKGLWDSASRGPSTLPSVPFLRRLRPFVSPSEDFLADARVEIRISRRTDDERIEIARDADGTFTVTREDADGQRNKATYDSEEALAEGDPAAHELFIAHVRSGPVALLRVRPNPDALPQWRREFQTDVERKLREALERAKQSRTEALRELNRARERATEAWEQARREYRRYLRPGRDDARTLIARIDPSGAITILERRADKETKYRFDSIEDLRAAEPELHEQLRELLPQ